MNFAQIAAAVPWLPIFWTLFTLFAVCGLVAVVSPHWFRRLARGSSRWIDTSQIVAKLDASIDIDEKVIPHCRLLGAAVLGSLALLAVVILR